MKIYESKVEIRCNEECKTELGPDCINCDKGKVYVVKGGNIQAELKREKTAVKKVKK